MTPQMGRRMEPGSARKRRVLRSSRDGASIENSLHTVAKKSHCKHPFPHTCGSTEKTSHYGTLGSQRERERDAYVSEHLRDPRRPRRAICEPSARMPRGRRRWLRENFRRSKTGTHRRARRWRVRVESRPVQSELCISPKAEFIHVSRVHTRLHKGTWDWQIQYLLLRRHEPVSTKRNKELKSNHHKQAPRAL